MRVLVVEDDPKLAAALKRGLEEAGMGVAHAWDGNEALAAARASAFDTIVLDVMLPGKVDGFDVAAALRRLRIDTPILMLTGRDAVDDRVRGLEAGADDYLLKPFAFQELVARIRALARRHLPGRSAVLRAGPVSLDSSSRTVTVDGERVHLTAKELSVLEYFLLNPGQVLSRSQVLEYAWAGETDDANLVEVYVGRVRRKLVAAGSPDPITTVRGAGYRMDLAPG